MTSLWPVVRSNSPVICAHEGIRNRSGKQDQYGVAVRFKDREA
jgi:hypothetical protein